MESGYKHFSHMHNLMMHEMPEGVDVTCSGCNSSATNNVYVCWQCNFFLHEQCFQATRSRKHPSHPLHPLTLVPYPTYPSNSFYCNSCKIVGTGFSYSCSDCDFDIHVQCAYSISSATNFHQPQHVSTPHTHNLAHPNQEIITAPSLHDQNSWIIPNVGSVSIPVPTPIPVHAQNLNVPDQCSYMTQYLSHPNQEIVPPSLHGQSSPIVPNALIPTPIPIPIPTPQNPTTAQDSYTPQNFAPYSVPTSAQNAYIAQNVTNVPASAQNSYVPQNIAVVFIPTNALDNQSASYGESGQNKPRNKGIIHFSHPHGLVLAGKKLGACSGCEEPLVGKSYSCVEANCDFNLHQTCFNLQKEIQHKSHPDHPLTLLSSSPYDNEDGKFTCNACFRDSTGFTYHCSICDFDLHVKCATLIETVKRDDHEHVLKLLYKCPVKGDEYTFYCDVCHGVVPRDEWTYYCKGCDYGTHLGCVDREECDETNGDDVGDARTGVKTLEEAMEIARINAISRAHMLSLV